MKSNLWSISVNGIGHSYIFGSIHVDLRHSGWAIPEIRPILASCESFYSETSFEPIDLRHFFGPQSWLEEVDIRKRLKWDGILQKKYATDLNRWSDLPPLLLYNYLSVMDSVGVDSSPMDMQLYKEAHELGLTCDGLTSQMEHFSIIKSISIDEQIKLLKTYLSHYSKHKKKFEALFRLYRQGEIHKLSNISSKASGALRDILLVSRNIDWASSINDKVRKRPTFFVVGAGHLGGMKGLLRLLKRNYNLDIKKI